MRQSGVILHISSLPSPYGIGSMGAEARQFVDFLAQAGLRYWQILPLGETNDSNSPYQSPSVFAGNHLFIDLRQLCAEGLLEQSELDAIYQAMRNREEPYLHYLNSANQEVTENGSS